MTTYLFIPPQGSSDYWHDAVSLVADLPASGNFTGEVRHVLADNSLRYWDGAAWGTLVAGAAGTYVLKAGDTMSGNLVISTLTASRALVTDGSKTLSSSATTATEIGYVNGVTSAIQTQLNGKEATITGAATTITGSNLTVSRAVISNGSGKVDVSATTDTELGYVSGVTSAIQTQLNGKEATITGGATSITSANLTVDRALASDGSGKVAVSAVTATELGYVSGVTSAIQTQIGTKVTGAASSTDEALARFDSTTGKIVQDSAVTLSDAGGMVFTGTTGFLRLPNLNETQRDALTAANGMLIYNTTTNKVQARENGAWNDVTGWGA